jgi:hypothetical protein
MWQKILDYYWLGWVKSKLLTFRFNSQPYHYFCHRYNATWRNERIIEIPLIWREVEQASDKKILELGNVLAHYFPVTHTVVDKYEKAPGVINQDVVDFKPKQKFDLIVSVSTLEHVGYDETPRDPKKIAATVRHLKSLLAKSGRLVMTFPVGYNPNLDSLLKKSKLGFDQIYYLERTSVHNLWHQRASRFKTARYGQPFTNANMVAVGLAKRN